MKTEHDKEMFVCKRLKNMGFACGHKIKLYGDEFDLESNPGPQGSQYVIEGISHRTGTLRRVRIPIMIVGLIEHEFDVMEELLPAA